MSIINYELLCGWRDVCEYLSSCWHNFAEADELAKKCFVAKNQILWSIEGKIFLGQLWDAHLIQFIRWGEHPIFYHYDSHCNRASSKVFGCFLVPDWEIKIDFLEQVILLNRDPQTLDKPWQPKVQRQIEERERQEAMRLRQYNEMLARYDPEKRRALMKERLLSGLCPHCSVPQAALMMDCPSCGKSYEEIG